MLSSSPFVRDVAVTAVIFGFAAFVWFGWAQEAPPARWRPWLGVGSGLGVLLAAVGGFLAWQNWGPESALAVDGAGETFGIVVGIEFALCGIGAAVLGATKRRQWIPAWIAFVVGVHFVPLASVFQDGSMVVLAVAVVLAVGLGLVIARRRGLTPSAAVGAATGVVFLIFAARAVVAVALG